MPEPTIEDLKNNLKPLTGAETEPLCAIDTSGSMSYPAAKGSSVTRWDVVTEGISRVVRVLEAKDSQAAAERAAGADEAEIGGLMTVTDGEAEDGDEFGRILAQQGGHTYVVVAVVGFGDEHDRTLAQYRKIEADNNHVRVLTFDSVTDPQTIADSLLALIGE